MTVTIQELPALRLVGLRCFGRREELPGRVAPAWRTLAERAPEIVGRLDPELFYGVSPEAQHFAPPPDGVYIYWDGHPARADRAGAPSVGCRP